MSGSLKRLFERTPRQRGIKGALERRSVGRRRAQRIDQIKGFVRGKGPWVALAGGIASLGGIVVAKRHAIARQARLLPGRARGAAYRITRRHPARDVSDDILVDRIRSTIGSVEKRLDIPRVHVTSTNGLTVIHGSVGTQEEAHQVEQAVAAVPGVRSVESHLHIGLSGADTRPSEGRKRARALKVGRIRSRKDADAEQEIRIP